MKRAVPGIRIKAIGWDKEGKKHQTVFQGNPAVADEIEVQIRQKLLGSKLPAEEAEEAKTAKETGNDE